MPALFDQRVMEGSEIISEFLIAKWSTIWEEWYDLIHDPYHLVGSYDIKNTSDAELFSFFKDYACTPANSGISYRTLDFIIEQPKSCLTLYNMVKELDETTISGIANSLTVRFGSNHFHDFTYEKSGSIWMDVPVYFNDLGTRYLTSLSDYSRRVLGGFFWLSAEKLFQSKMTGDFEKEGFMAALTLVGNPGGFPIPRFGYFSPIGYNPTPTL